MKAVLIRTGSVPVLSSPGSPRVSLYRHDSKSSVSSPRVSIHLDSNRAPTRGIRRVSSESDVIQSEIGFSRLSGAGSRSFPERIPEEEYLLSESEEDGGLGSTSLKINSAGMFPVANIGIPLEELGFSGGGFGKGKNTGGEGGGGDYRIGNGEERSKMGAYYLEMLESNPGDSLLLRNYAKFLHEVEKDSVRAEEYYGRAILASPGDGELLSLYAKLIWETQKDGERAKSYFNQALYASPDDSTVLGSYAHFMWEADDDEDEESNGVVGATPALVAAF
uniref:Uncharacterized protein n=1 Tax=Fagus sylvatica TaxID=28930 RepID=A0A2N9GAD9_FAGSY